MKFILVTKAHHKLKEPFDKFKLQPQENIGIDSKVDRFSSSQAMQNVLKLSKKERIIWEWRSFWPQSVKEIILFQAGFTSFTWEDFTYHPFEDIYFIIKGCPLNLKIRKDKLFYKPLVEEYNKLLAFSYKQKIKFPLLWKDLYPLTPRAQLFKNSIFSPEELAHYLEKSGYQVTLFPVKKDSYRCKVSETLQIELTHLHIGTRTWYSVCIEGLDENQVRECAYLTITQAGEVMGYVEFLDKYGSNIISEIYWGRLVKPLNRCKIR
jgi:hypothetical protein